MRYTHLIIYHSHVSTVYIVRDLRETPDHVTAVGRVIATGNGPAAVGEKEGHLTFAVEANLDVVPL